MFCCFAWHWILIVFWTVTENATFLINYCLNSLSSSGCFCSHMVHSSAFLKFMLQLVFLSAAWLKVLPYHFPRLAQTRNAHPFPWASPLLCKARKLARIWFLLTFPFRIIDTGTPGAFLSKAAYMGMNDACRGKDNSNLGRNLWLPFKFLWLDPLACMLRRSMNHPLEAFL